MRSVSRLALGLMLGLAGASMAATPVIARDKKETVPEGPKADYSKPFIAVAGDLEKAMKANDFAALAAAVAKAEPVASTPDDLYILNFYKFQLAGANKDAAMQRTSMEAMLATGKTQPAQVAQFESIAGRFAFQAQEYDKAIDHLMKSKAANPADGEVRYLLAEAYFSKGVAIAAGKITPASQPILAQGMVELQGAVDAVKAAGGTVEPAWYGRGANISRALNAPDASKWILASLDGQANPQGWSDLLTLYQQQHPQLTKGENLDVMRLKYQTGALLSEFDYGEYVEAASKSGLLGEVKAVIDQGRSKGKLAPTKLADYYQAANSAMASDKASLPASEVSAGKAPTGRLAAATADAHLGYGDYAKAVSLYRLALQKGSVDAAEINMRIGIALALSGDTAGAKAAFDLVPAGSRQGIAQLWTLWLSKKTAA